MMSTPDILEMEASIRAVEEIVGYKFKNKKLLEDALTHSSFIKSNSYERLEFLGDAALGIVVSDYLFKSYPDQDLDPEKLTLLRSANTSTERFARVLVRHGLFRYVRHSAAAVENEVRKFSLSIQDEGDAVAYGGAIKAPKILADIVESVAGAIYIDCDFNLTVLWQVFQPLLEPIVSIENLQQDPEPVSKLYKLCQKHGQLVEIKNWRKGDKSIANVYVDEKLIATSSTEQKETARLNAAKNALKLAESEVDGEKTDDFKVFNGMQEIDEAKQRLHELCSKQRLPKPTYSIEEEDGPASRRRFICSAQIDASMIDASIGIVTMMGDMKSRVKDAENSAASFMLQHLQNNL